MVCEMGSTEIKGQEGLEPPRYRREQEIANAEFIAASRTLMPKLLKAVRALEFYADGRHQGLKQIPCPDDKPGCLVYHATGYTRENGQIAKDALKELESE